MRTYLEGRRLYKIGVYTPVEPEPEPEPQGVKAFPTAYGAGANASGGRGGTVSVVTNLNDSGPGSLRSFANTSNTTIIFDVSGVIQLNSNLWMQASNVTIAGQTAPEGGITIAGASVVFQGNKNLICRYIRFRGGYHDYNADSIGGFYWENVILDHCSISFGADEGLEVSVDTVSEFGGNVTIQNCLIAESKTGVYTGGDVAADQFGDFSFLRNVFYNISHRVPNIASNSRYDIINNYSHNIYWRLTRGNGSYKINQIGNVFDYGDTPITNDRMNLHGCEARYTLPTIYTDNNLFIGTIANQETHPLDNTIAEINADNKLSWKYFYDDDVCGFGMKTRGDQLEPIFFTDTMYPLMGIAPTVLTRENVESTIVPNAGASKRLNADGTVSDNNDVLDTEWKYNIQNKIYTAYGDRYTWSVPAIPSVSRPAGFYVNNPYIPEEWFSANVPSGQNHNDLSPYGYTWLEEYINSVDRPYTPPAIKAFPSAYGAGAMTTGGRGGQVLHVTNLNDSGLGSFREALFTTGARTIVFDVSGVIELNSAIYMDGSQYDNATINGFSAPYGGITIIGSEIKIGNTSNMIWRGIRFRNGYKPAESQYLLNRNCLQFYQSTDIIVDRCSFAYANSQATGADAAWDQGTGGNVTFQNLLIGNTSQGIIIGNSDGESYGSASILRNVISNTGWRHPKFGGALTLDLINNFSHNWQGRTLRGDAWDYKLNHIGNYYQGGALTNIAERTDKKMFGTWTNAIMNPQIWDEDNFISPENRAAGYPTNPWDGWYQFPDSTSSPEPIKTTWWVNSRLPIQGVPIPILSSSNLKTELFPKVGACEYTMDDGNIGFYRDNVDVDLINAAQDRTMTGHIQSSEYETLALALKTSMPSQIRSNEFYGVNQHIPQAFLAAKGVTNTLTVHNELAPSGYTWLEEYLNQVDRPYTPPAIKAFPTAYGGGANSTGGRGGNVYHVTNLLDDGSVGSFRWALSQPRPATIVFDVSGVIEAENSHYVNGENLTIAGQSAPQGGISITYPPLNWRFQIGQVNNITIRYIRIRNQFYPNGGLEIMPGYGNILVPENPPNHATNIIMDHMSINWAGTQGLNIRGQDTNNITWQNGIISECSRGSLFGDTNYESSSNTTFRNSVFYHVTHRVPNNSSTATDTYNNVIYDWTNRLTVVKDGGNLNLFNNYYYKGNRTELVNYWGVRYVNGITLIEPTGTVSVYSSGNVLQDFFDGTINSNERENIWMRHAGYDISQSDQQKLIPDSSLFTNTPHPYIGIMPNNILTAKQAATIVPNEAGANKYLNADGSYGIFRDEPDDRVINAILTDTTTPWSVDGGTDGKHTAIDSPSYNNYLASVNGVPINTRPVGFYGTNPHIPEAFLTARGVNNTLTVHNELAPSGYTWLEEYLNQVDV